MKRGEIWTVSGGGNYAGKARPVVVVQDDVVRRLPLDFDLLFRQDLGGGLRVAHALTAPAAVGGELSESGRRLTPG